MNGRAILRSVCLGLAGVFFIATLFQLADQLNLIYQPPSIPESANLVERVTALIPYRQNDWPIFLAANGFLAVGFLVLIALGLVLAARVPRDDGRRHLLLWTLVTAGLLGAAGQLVLLGAVRTSIAIPYCDCGFKNEEIVSQVWAEMVVGGAVQWLVYGASILAAAGLIVAARVYGGRAMPESWAWLSYVAAALLVIIVALGYADVTGDLANWLTALVTGILVPWWAAWLGLRLEGAAPAQPSTSDAAA